jgi:hypothetical protein
MMICFISDLFSNISGFMALSGLDFPGHSGGSGRRLPAEFR